MNRFDIFYVHPITLNKTGMNKKTFAALLSLVLFGLAVSWKFNHPAPSPAAKAAPVAPRVVEKQAQRTPLVPEQTPLQNPAEVGKVKEPRVLTQEAQISAIYDDALATLHLSDADFSKVKNYLLERWKVQDDAIELVGK